MNESDLKRYLIRSIRLQGGVGHRIEDKFKVGWPDMIMIPDSEPVFFVEVKLVKGARLICTELQEERLGELWRPPHALSCIVGLKDRWLYIGQQGEKLVDCLSVERPAKLDSPDWSISYLLTYYRRHRLDSRAHSILKRSGMETEPSP